MSLETTLSNMVGRTITEVGTEDDELMIALDDGMVFWIHIDEDGEGLMMTVSREEVMPKQ